MNTEIRKVVRDEKGRYVSAKAAEAIAEAEQIEKQAAYLTAQAAAVRAKADEMIAAEANAPEWLKSLVVAIADQLGISAEEFKERVRIIHPTAVDPVLMVDDKPVVAWV